MTRRYDKSVFLSALIFLFLAGGLFGATQEDKKEKKKEPFRYFDTSTGAATYEEAKEKAKKKKEPTKANETSTTTPQTFGIVGTEAGQPLPVVVKPLKDNLVTDDEVNMEIPGIEVAYVNGKPHGKAILRYKNGTRIEGEYDNGKKVGLWITYSKQERKCDQKSYKDDKKDGKFISWHESGYVYETEFKDDLMHGKQCSWDKNGKLIYEHGFKNGKRHGRFVSWYSNGDKCKEGYFNEGTGKLSTWFPSGKISTEAEFKNGKPYGKEIWWHENGQKKHERTYSEEGKSIGKSTYWDRDGKVISEMEFDQDGQRLYYKEYDKDGKLIILNERPTDKKKTINNYVTNTRQLDLRTLNKVTEVKDQLRTNWSNTCWAFGYLGALESRLMPPIIPFPAPDYSEQHLADKNHGFDANGLTAGGNFSMALAYLTRGGGPIAETDMPYDPVHALGRQTSFPAKK